MAKSYRAGRLGEEIKKIIGNMLLRELKDPRLQGKMVSVSDVDVSDDGSYATVYLTILGRCIESDADAQEKKDILDAMKSAQGFMRREIGKNVKLRHVPELRFKIDGSLEYGRHMSQIIDSLDIRHDDDDTPDTEKVEE
jgi:ribosome-binding factor A